MRGVSVQSADVIIHKELSFRSITQFEYQFILLSPDNSNILIQDVFLYRLASMDYHGVIM